MKKIFRNFSVINKTVALTIAITGMLVISACGGTTSVSHDEAYQAGYTIGRIISGN
ncbi:MAG: hypothetical protein K2L21_01975 [Muribaculaceae bacterium]|nr:hypothetical protein [Muribaculaceae bacterium]